MVQLSKQLEGGLGAEREGGQGGGGEKGEV